MITITVTEPQISMHGDELKLYPHTSPGAVLWSRKIQEAECKYIVYGKYVSDKNVTPFIKGWVVALLCAWQSWQWVTLFRRGFALSSIISHYYMSHLLPRIPMGDYTQTHPYTPASSHTHTFRWYSACLASIIPKTSAAHSGTWPRDLRFTTFTHLHNYSVTQEEKSPKWHWRTSSAHSRAEKFGSLGKHLSSFVWHYKTVEHEPRMSRGTNPTRDSWGL